MIYDATYDDAGDGYDWDIERGDGESGYRDADAEQSGGSGDLVSVRVTPAFWGETYAWAEDWGAQGRGIAVVERKTIVRLTMGRDVARDLLDHAAYGAEMCRRGGWGEDGFRLAGMYYAAERSLRQQLNRN